MVHREAASVVAAEEAGSTYLNNSLMPRHISVLQHSSADPVITTTSPRIALIPHRPSFIFAVGRGPIDEANRKSSLSAYQASPMVQLPHSLCRWRALACSRLYQVHSEAPVGSGLFRSGRASGDLLSMLCVASAEQSRYITSMRVASPLAGLQAHGSPNM